MSGASTDTPGLLGLLDAAGDDDLRDARALAWLLDPGASHGAGHTALNGLGVLLAGRGVPALSQALACVPPPPCASAVQLRKGEVELVMTLPALTLVLVWRSAPAPYAGAIEFAAADGALAVGVARVAGLFPPETSTTFPILLWPELGAALARVTGEGEAGGLVDSLLQRLSGV